MASWRDEVLHIVEGLDLEFLDTKIKFLIISPNHVNFDRMGNRRSSFSAAEISDLAYSLMLNETAAFEGSKDENEYYLLTGDILGKRYKMIIKLDQKNESIYVITLYRTKK